MATPTDTKRFGGVSEKCDVCTKSVYPVERISADGKVYHKNCLTCEKCKKILSLGNYAGLEGKMFCKPHFMELFKLKGNYSEGFGAEDPKKKWAAKPAGESAAAAPECSTAVAETVAEQERTLEPEAERDTKQEAVHEVESVSESAHLGVQDAVAAQEKDVEEVKVAEVEEAAQAAEDDAGENGDDVEIVEAALQAVPELLSAEALQDKPSPAQSQDAPKANGTKRFGSQLQDKCSICEKTVYPMEKITADNKTFHKLCLKCEQCSKTLSLGNYASAHGKYYCKPHYQALFKLKGNYDSGFGEEQHKAKWISN